MVAVDTSSPARGPEPSVQRTGPAGASAGGNSSGPTARLSRPGSHGWGPAAAPRWAVLRRLPPPSPRCTEGSGPRAGLLVSIATAVSSHTVAGQLRQAGPGSADYSRPRPAALKALVHVLGCSCRPPSPFPRTRLRARRATLDRAPLTTPAFTRHTASGAEALSAAGALSQWRCTGPPCWLR